jgi:putative CRISPR-associated protein (TIGR02619 family)
MATNLHILSVGTSTLTNFARAKTSPNPPKSAAAYVEAHHTQASAEINSLNAKTNFLADTKAAKKLSISLIYSETTDGKKAATILKKFLKNRVASIQMIPFVGIERAADQVYAPSVAQEMAEQSLSDLQEKLVKHLNKMNSRSETIHINITGGFKAEAAIIYFIGFHQSIPVYYLHESFKTCIHLPSGHD